MTDDAGARAWESVAGSWEANRQRVFDAFRPASDFLVAALDPQPGQTILEVAAGPGETGFLVAERLGPDGRLISTDIAPSMVAAARAGVAERGLQNVECRVMDATSLDLPEDSIDGALSRLGFMLVPNPPKAFRELRRVVRPGGTVAYVVIGAPDTNQWMSLMMGALMQNGHQVATGDPFEFGGPFSLSSADRNVELLHDAGFESVEVETITGAMPFDGAQDYWDLQTGLAGPVKATVETMSETDRNGVRATLAELLTPFETGGSFELPTQVVAVKAR